MKNGHILDKDTVARELAIRHFQLEEGLTRVFHLTGTETAEVLSGELIMLLEVSTSTVPTGVMPLYFRAAPTSGMPYRSVIIEVMPTEFDKIRANELKLPNGWTIGEEIARSIEFAEA